MNSNASLNIDKIDIFYGQVKALEEVSLYLKRGEIISLLGANGAGKTTTLRTISGLIKISSGDVLFDGISLSRLPPEKIVSLGISHVPEGRRIFPGLSVFGNLDVATTSWRKHRDNISKELDYVYNLFPRLKERTNQMGWSLSGGEQQMLAIGRALMAKPKLLLLDEPSLGLAPILQTAVFKTIRTINEDGMTILLVEQNASLAIKIVDRNYILENGKVILEGSSEEILKDERIKKAYLGG